MNNLPQDVLGYGFFFLGTYTLLVATLEVDKLDWVGSIKFAILALVELLISYLSFTYL